MRWGLSVLVGGAFMLARPAFAQQPEDSLAFRRGQWVAEFAAGTEARSLGVLRFLSPRRALVLDGSGGYFKATREQGNEGSNRELQVRLGVRWFRAVSPRVRQYFTLGASGGVRREQQRYQAPDPSPETGRTFRSIVGGGFANLGGMWLATEHLALGANWEAAYSYGRSTQRVAASANEVPANEARTTTHGLSVGTARLVVRVLF